MARQTEAVKRLVDQDLQNLTPFQHSWHSQYINSPYVYIGNLDPRLTEGDVITVLSQFGDVVDINLVRDKDTGKSLGFCFLGFDNPKSAVLAVDNLVGYALIGRPLRIDHILDYKPPRRYDEDAKDADGLAKRVEYVLTGAEGKGVGVYNVTESQRRLNQIAQVRPTGEVKSAALDDDEAWAKEFEHQMKREQPEIAVKRERSESRHRRRRRSRSKDRTASSRSKHS